MRLSQASAPVRTTGTGIEHTEMTYVRRHNQPPTHPPIHRCLPRHSGCSAYMVGNVVDAGQLLAELVSELSGGGLTGHQSEGEELLMLRVTGPPH